MTLKKRKKYFKELLILGLCLPIAIVFMAIFSDEKSSNEYYIRVFGIEHSMTPRLMLLHFWLVLYFIINTVRQIKLRFNNIASNILLILTCSFLVYFVTRSVFNAENLLSMYISHSSPTLDESVVQKLKLSKKLYLILGITFSIVGITALIKTILKVKNIAKRVASHRA